MDALAGLLDGTRARGAFLLRCSLDPPWSLRIEDEAPLAVTAVVRGHAVIWADGAPARRLGPGDLVVNRGPGPYTIADHPASPLLATIEPGQRCVGADGRDLHEELRKGVRGWGNSPDGETVLLTGAYQLRGEVSTRLLRALPEMIVLTAAEWSSPLVPLLAEEITRDGPGQEAVLDRLLDLLCITAVRTWLAGPEAQVPRWYGGYADPLVGHALGLLHHNPAHPWTVAGLAAATGTSRATLARRFAETVGEPPMAFLTGWRLALSADLLREPALTLSAIARQVGYATPYAFSTAFKRVYGTSPHEFRKRAAGGPDEVPRPSATRGRELATRWTR